jgi:hypothetical protein
MPLKLSMAVRRLTSRRSKGVWSAMSMKTHNLIGARFASPLRVIARQISPSALFCSTTFVLAQGDLF